MKLSDRQGALLLRVCLKRYEVVLEHYMGSWRPNESVLVYEHKSADERNFDTAERDGNFRPSTLESLRAKGLVRYLSRGSGTSEVKPTKAGLAMLSEIIKKKEA